ncbi:hypothetical protein HRbin08_01342 [bacterium HR08]|nr:hypothetical protein HRbin08_01342 [bacterium HR08]
MRITRADAIFVGFILSLLLFLLFLSTRPRASPSPLPRDDAHRMARTRSECLACHDPEPPTAPYPLRSSHPQKWRDATFACTRCHPRE